MSQAHEGVRLTQVRDYQFDIHYGESLPVLRADEPAPLGQGTGPSPVQLLASAVGNCLSASLLFAFRKFKQNVEPLRCEVTAEVGRNAEYRLRVLALRARLELGVPATGVEQVQRVMDTFESYCTVTQSVHPGIAVSTEVFDSTGARLK